MHTCSDIPRERLLGIALLGQNLMELDAQLKKPQRSPYSELRITPEGWAAARKAVEEEELARVTNSRGEIVPTVFPSND